MLFPSVKSHFMQPFATTSAKSEESSSTRLSSIARNLNKLTVPIFALVAISLMQRVTAGPISYAACVSGCESALVLGGSAATAPTGGWGGIIANFAAQYFCPTVCAPVLLAPTL